MSLTYEPASEPLHISVVARLGTAAHPADLLGVAIEEGHDWVDHRVVMEHHQRPGVWGLGFQGLRLGLGFRV